MTARRSSPGLKRRYFLGVTVTNLNSRNHKYATFSGGKGVSVTNIIPASAASAAGLKTGDIIVEVNGAPVTNRKEFAKIIQRQIQNPAEEANGLKLNIIRRQVPVFINVFLKELPHETDQNFKVQYSSIVSNGKKLRIIITKPAKRGTYPGIIFIQGIECMSVDFPFIDHPYKKLLYGFSGLGFCTVRIEQQGVGDSQGLPGRDIDFNTWLSDYKEAARQIKAIDFIDKQKLFVFGYSLGGVIAPLIAKTIGAAGVVVFGTIARPWNQHVIETTLRQMQLSKKGVDNVNEEIKSLGEFLYLLNEKKLLPKQIIASKPEFKKLLKNGKYFYGRHYSYFQQLSEFNLLKAWQELDAAVLIVFGAADYVASLEDHKLIYDIVKNKQPMRNIKMQIVDVDHWFHGVASMERSFKKDYDSEFCHKTMKTIALWFKELL